MDRYRLALICIVVMSGLALAEQVAAPDFERFLKKERVAIIQAQKHIAAGEFDHAIGLLELANQRFPDHEVLLSLHGEALYKVGRLDEAEPLLSQALLVNPFNRVAKDTIEEIRTTKLNQVSTEWQEWVSIFKDKVGDFIVTFLALFTAFLLNSMIEPLMLRLRLNHARRLFTRGDYDEFTDMAESLLDIENFAPLRANFRFMLRQRGFEESRDILNTYVNTVERLPSLLRILERENQKLLEPGQQAGFFSGRL